MAALRPGAINPLPRWQRRGVQLSLYALAATGSLWLLVHYAWGSGAGELPHPLELWMIRLHGALAMLALFFVGVLATVHVPRGWRLVRQRRTGGGLLACMAGLTLSGYALYYFAPETLRPWIGNVHAAIGVGAAALLAWHGRIRRPG